MNEKQVAVLKREVNGDASEAALLKCCELSDGKVKPGILSNLSSSLNNQGDGVQGGEEESM